ncbi:MAG TPA: hypothetical protein EYG86_08245 [Crocinitomicaceae bacterium]|nr:hypothetical protein [Crocinitomicaceae bacterium]
MKYLLFILVIGGFTFTSSAQTKAKPAAKKTQRVTASDSNESSRKAKKKPATKPINSAKPKSATIRKRPGKIKVAPKKKD